MPIDCQAINLEDDEDLEEVKQIKDKLGFLQRIEQSEFAYENVLSAVGQVVEQGE